MARKREKHATDLRRDANGKDCLIRLPGICTGDESTTVHAHIRRGGVAGVGQKPVDLCGVRACFSCHDAIDARVDSRIPRGELDGYILEAVMRQLDEWAKREVVKW